MQNSLENQEAQKRKYELAECLSAVGDREQPDLHLDTQWPKTGNNNMKAQT